MAGEWIKVRTNLWDDPRIAQLVEITDQSEAAVIGGLYWLWATADEHSSDGLLHGMTTRTIDRKTGVTGLGAALVSIGWLSENAEGVTVSRFDEHNGASAKQRAQTAKRVSTHKGNAKVTQQALPEQQDTVTDALPREDKRREELKTLVAAATEGRLEDKDGENNSRLKPQPTTEDRDAAGWLLRAQQKVTPKMKAPNLDKWADHIRLMRTVDGRTHREICELFQWAKADAFWSPNCQSPEKLREKWDQLAEKRERSTPAVVRQDFAEVL
jgi:predicted transcriptional regulator